MALLLYLLRASSYIFRGRLQMGCIQPSVVRISLIRKIMYVPLEIGERLILWHLNIGANYLDNWRFR